MRGLLIREPIEGWRLQKQFPIVAGIQEMAKAGSQMLCQEQILQRGTAPRSVR